MEGKQTGFTLIELILVLSVLSTVVIYPIINLTSIREDYILRSEVKKLYSIILATRQEAVSTYQPQSISFDKRTYFKSSVQGDIKEYNLAPEIKIEAINFAFGRKELIFQPLGTCLGGNIVISNQQGSSYCIIVYGATGRVRWERCG